MAFLPIAIPGFIAVVSVLSLKILLAKAAYERAKVEYERAKVERDTAVINAEAQRHTEEYTLQRAIVEARAAEERLTEARKAEQRALSKLAEAEDKKKKWWPWSK